jgi:hypothetical protein
VLVGLFALWTSTLAFAQTSTPQPVSISVLRTGWANDAFAISTAEGMYLNPASCSLPDGYLSTKADPGFTTFLAAAMLAVATHRLVTVTVSNSACSSERPRIIGIDIRG